MNLILLLPLAGILLCSAQSTEAHEFYVEGSNGWVVQPGESYDLWAESLRFQVGDELVFEYRKGEDSVLLVTEENFQSCNTSNPIRKMDDGESVFLLDRSGPFFFISGAAGHCVQGQKLTVVVMAVRMKPAPSLPSPSPAPSARPSSPPPASPAPSMRPPNVPSPAPSVKPPSASPPRPASSSSPSPSPAFFPTSTPATSSAHVMGFSWLSCGLLSLFLGAMIRA